MAGLPLQLRQKCPGLHLQVLQPHPRLLQEIIRELIRVRPVPSRDPASLRKRFDAQLVELEREVRPDKGQLLFLVEISLALRLHGAQVDLGLPGSEDDALQRLPGLGLSRLPGPREIRQVLAQVGDERTQGAFGDRINHYCSAGPGALLDNKGSDLFIGTRK